MSLTITALKKTRQKKGFPAQAPNAVWGNGMSRVWAIEQIITTGLEKK